MGDESADHRALAEDEDRSFDDLRSGRTPAGSMPLE